MKRKYGQTYPTWQGIYLTGIFIALCAAALTRQINLLLFIAGLLLGPLILSWYLVKIRKGWFRVQRRLPEIIHAESEFIFSLDLTNVSRGTLFALAARQDILDCRQTEEDGSQDNSLPAAYCLLPTVFNFFFPRLAPNQKQTQERSCQIPRPGEYRLEPVKLISRFPLGLFECRITIGRRATFWVYPALLETLPEDLIQLTAQNWDGVPRETFYPSGSIGDFHSVSAYRPGEDSRLIHWRSSARQGDLVLRRFEPPVGAWIGIVVDMTPPDDWDETVQTDMPENTQLAIKTAATVIYRLCNHQVDFTQRDAQIVLAVTSSENPILSGRSDAAFYHQAMRELAVAKLNAPSQNSVENAVAAVRERIPEGTQVLVLGGKS